MFIKVQLAKNRPWCIHLSSLIEVGIYILQKTYQTLLSPFQNAF